MRELICGNSTINLRLQCWKGPTKRPLNLFKKLRLLEKNVEEQDKVCCVVMFVNIWLILLYVAISELQPFVAYCLLFQIWTYDRHSHVGIFGMSVMQQCILNAFYRDFPRPQKITFNFKLEQQANFICNVHRAFTKPALSINKHSGSGDAMNRYVATLLFALQWAFPQEMLNFEPERLLQCSNIPLKKTLMMPQWKLNFSLFMLLKHLMKWRSTSNHSYTRH